VPFDAIQACGPARLHDRPDPCRRLTEDDAEVRDVPAEPVPVQPWVQHVLAERDAEVCGLVRAARTETMHDHAERREAPFDQESGAAGTDEGDGGGARRIPFARENRRQPCEQRLHVGDGRPGTGGEKVEGSAAHA